MQICLVDSFVAMIGVKKANDACQENAVVVSGVFIPFSICRKLNRLITVNLNFDNAHSASLQNGFSLPRK